MIAGATELEAASFSPSLGPVFLSSLHCRESDISLLEDCYHDQLGLGLCGDEYGPAVVKCFGEIIISCKKGFLNLLYGIRY